VRDINSSFEKEKKMATYITKDGWKFTRNEDGTVWIATATAQIPGNSHGMDDVVTILDADDWYNVVHLGESTEGNLASPGEPLYSIGPDFGPNPVLGELND
jgi:hypothetical protein